MSTFNSVLSASALVLAVSASLVSADAQAVTQQRFVMANATNFCQTALPVFDGAVRKRPLAVQNEGTSNAFITCSYANEATPLLIDVYAQNLDTVAKNLSCTMVTGFATGNNQFVTKTVSLPAGGTQIPLSWRPADFTGGVWPTDGGSTAYSISCNLLPRVGINDTVISYLEDVGA